MLYLFQDRDSDVFAFTSDEAGHNLPRASDTRWVFLESMDTIAFAWGEEHFGEVYAAIDRDGFFVFYGELEPLPTHRVDLARTAKTFYSA
jgi:hypothetical protein